MERAVQPKDAKEAIDALENMSFKKKLDMYFAAAKETT